MLDVYLNGSNAWTEQAICQGMDNIFVPVSEVAGMKGRPSKATEKLYEQARAICSICPVQFECADAGIRENRQHGIWGGTDPTTRRLLAPLWDRLTIAEKMDVLQP